MQTQASRTWLCSVVFLDIVGYSKRPVAGQLDIKEHLNHLIRHALTGAREEDVIILDSGDGAAVCFLADPVEALFFALGVHSSLTGDSEPPRPDYACRMGINLGPVKVIRDVNGRRNTVGDGINSAQRVMDFAEPGQLLVSRSFHDVIACLSEEYNKLFSYLGIRHDKHVKEYDIYEVSSPVEELIQGRSAAAPNTIAPAVPQTMLSPTWDDAVLDHATQALAERIGPLAKVLVQRAAKRACSPRDLYEMLAQHLPDPGLRELFIEALTQGEPRGGPNQPPAQPRRDDQQLPLHSQAPAGADIKLTEEVREQLRHRLAEHLGPLAKLIVKRALTQANDYAGLCQLLAQELPDGDRQGFINYAMKLWKPS